MEILSQGQKIITKSGKVNGIITAACIRGKNVSYEVQYFLNNSFEQCWLYPFEFDVDNTQKQTPGFKVRPIINTNN